MKKWLLFFLLLLIATGIVAVYQWRSVHDGKLHVIFCDVGQGDGILVRTPKDTLFVIDAGPDDSMAGCLSRHTAFWERDIALAFLTHPHLDHFIGYEYILKSYRLRQFVTEKLRNETQTYQYLESLLVQFRVPTTRAFAGDSIQIGDAMTLSVLAPTTTFLTRSSPNGMIGEKKEFASLILGLSYGSFAVLFTGDSQQEQLTEALKAWQKPVTILQVPHHGSHTGLSGEALKLAQPKLAIISVGKKNRYHHPSPLTITLLQALQIPVARTDQEGDIELTSDGKTWTVR